MIHWSIDFEIVRSYCFEVHVITWKIFKYQLLKFFLPLLCSYFTKNTTVMIKKYFSLFAIKKDLITIVTEIQNLEFYHSLNFSLLLSATFRRPYGWHDAKIFLPENFPEAAYTSGWVDLTPLPTFFFGNPKSKLQLKSLSLWA